MSLKCCTQYVSKFGKLSGGHRTGKGQFSFQSQRKAIKEFQTTVQPHAFHRLTRLCSKYSTSALTSHASKVKLKILQARFQQFVNQELPDVQVRFTKGRGTRDQIANIC